MKIEVEPGSYIVAVSGGVDSMALLHMLRECPGLQLAVAHFDHGIRADSEDDRRLVQQTAEVYGLPFVYSEGHLGSGASEATARKARYGFLYAERRRAGADAVITAHHSDDVLETAIINMHRGTGRLGLTGLQDTAAVKRPLLGVSKVELLEYARQHSLSWRDDETNSDTAYLRNHVRQVLKDRFTEADRVRLRQIIDQMQDINTALNAELSDALVTHTTHQGLHRLWFVSLPHAVSREVMAAWLRRQDVRNFDKKMLERLTHAAKIHRDGQYVSVDSDTRLKVTTKYLALEHIER